MSSLILAAFLFGSVPACGNSCCPGAAAAAPGAALAALQTDRGLVPPFCPAPRRMRACGVSCFDEDVREAPASGRLPTFIGARWTPAEARIFVSLLKHGSLEMRRFAVSELGEIEPPVNWVIPALVRVLRKDPDPEMRTAAAEALKKMGTTQATYALRTSLASPADPVVAHIRKILEENAKLEEARRVRREEEAKSEFFLELFDPRAVLPGDSKR